MVCNIGCRVRSLPDVRPRGGHADADRNPNYYAERNPDHYADVNTDRHAHADRHPHGDAHRDPDRVRPRFLQRHLLAQIQRKDQERKS